MIDTKYVSPLLQGALSLRAGERFRNCWSARLSYQSIGERTATVMWGQGTIKAILKGIIVVTNQRLLFVEEAGAFSKIYNLRDYVELDSVKGTSSGKNHFSVTVEKGGTVRPLFFSEIRDCNPSTLGKLEKIDTGRIKIYIDKLVNNSVRETEEENRRKEENERRKRVQYVLDFSFLKAQMEKGGLVVETVKCPTCNANVKMPETGTVFECNYCGNTIQALDLFEKMKGLIGGL